MGPSLVASNTFECRSTGPHKMGPGGIPPGIPLQLTPAAQKNTKNLQGLVAPE